MKRSQRLALIGAAAAALLTVTTIDAHAADGPSYAGCSTTGASGAATFTNWTALHVDIDMNVYDISPDGHSVAIRFISDQVNKPYQYWPWHYNYRGSGKPIEVRTHADNSRGYLNYVGVEVATMEGSKVVHSCIDWVGDGSP
ncbi:hypothetical protein ACWC0C_22690 [Streptomyces sp. NPDC001709]